MKEYKDELEYGLLSHLEDLCREKGCVPEEIGIAVLKACGFKVKQYLTGGVSVWDADGSLQYHFSS